MSKLDAALALAARGFKVFPIKDGAKAPPLINDWPSRASTDASKFPPDANIGIHTEGFIVLDIDVKKGGNDSLAFLQMANDLPDTLTTITPSGGRHLFYRLPTGHPGVPNGVNVLGQGIDVRSTNGYVVAPGSELPAGRYRFEADCQMADAPEWLVLKLGTIVPKTSTTATPVPDAPPEKVMQATDWLARQPGAEEGNGGDAHTFAVTAGLRDFGLSREQTLNLLDNHWNDRCQPPWSPADLATKVDNAYAYAQNAPGIKGVAADEFPVSDQPLPPAKKLPVAARLSEFANQESRGPGYLIKGLLQRGSYAELFGAPGAGKTFAALDMEYHIAAGKEWMGRKIHKGLVLHLAYEGIGGLRKRGKALRQRYGDEDVPLYIVSAGFSLRELAGRQAMASILASLPEKPVLIVIDTFARALMGGDENSAQDVGAFNSAVGALIETTGACVMIIHHSGKNKNAGARGSSALLGAIDTELEVDNHQVIARKQRDVETGEPVGFKLVPVTVGLDEDGDEMTSCVVEPDATAGSGGGIGRLSGNPKRGFDVLCDLRPDNSPITDMEWREGCKEFLGTKSVSQRFWDIKKALLRKGVIEVDSEGFVTRRMT